MLRVLLKTRVLLVKGEEIVVDRLELHDLVGKENCAVYARKGF